LSWIDSMNIVVQHTLSRHTTKNFKMYIPDEPTKYVWRKNLAKHA
jgi:hypothetical protein